MCYPQIAPDSVGWVTEAQMMEVDRVMIDDLGIDLPRMMENAGRNLARVAIDVFEPDRVAIVAGAGGNGGGGLVAARHLAVAGIDVVVLPSRRPVELTGVTGAQMEILRRMNVGIDADANRLPGCDIVIDALIGYSLRGAPRNRIRDLIELANASGAVLSLDTPSGLDVTTGTTPGTVVRADVTMTLALPKTGLRACEHVGRFLLADISVPRSVTDPLGGAPDFRCSPIVELADA